MAQNLTILQGKTFSRVVRWEALPFVYKAITAITKAAPAVVTSPAHGAPDGWRVAVVSAKGMTEINASNPPKDREFKKATRVDADTISLNDVNASEYSTYESGGYVQYYTPVDLAGFTARMQIKDKVGGTVLASSDVDDLPLNIITIAIDNTLKTITVTISATNTAAIVWKKGVYDLEMISAGGEVTALLSGEVEVVFEVTTAT